MIADYRKRLVEVDEILNYLDEEEYEKIPKDVIQAIKDNKDNEYTWKYDETKELKDQDVSKDTIAILSYLNMEYLLNEEQRKVMEQIHQMNEDKLEKEKREKYKSEDLFKKEDVNDKKLNQEEGKKQETKSNIVPTNEEGFFRKLINKIKRFFRKENK